MNHERLCREVSERPFSLCDVQAEGLDHANNMNRKR